MITLLTAADAPNEIVVQAAQHLRGAERDGTYAELLAPRSQALSLLPER